MAVDVVVDLWGRERGEAGGRGGPLKTPCRPGQALALTCVAMLSFSSLSFTSSFMLPSMRSAHSRSAAAAAAAPLAAAFCRLVGECSGSAAGQRGVAAATQPLGAAGIVGGKESHSLTTATPAAARCSLQPAVRGDPLA